MGLAVNDSREQQAQLSRSGLYRRRARRHVQGIIEEYRTSRFKTYTSDELIARASFATKIHSLNPNKKTEASFRVQAKLRDSSTKEYEIKYLPHELPRLSATNTRSALKLPRIEESQIKTAKKIKKEFIDQVNIQQPPNSIEKIRAVYQEAAKKVLGSRHDAADHVELEAIVYAMCLNDRKSPLQSLPRGYIKPDDEFVIKMRTLARYGFSEINKLENPEDFRKVTNWKNFFKKCNVNFNEFLTVKDLLRLTYPGWLEGERPLIRPHTLILTGNYAHTEGEDKSKPSRAAIAAARCIFLDQEGVVDKNGDYVRSVIEKIDWHEVYRDRINGIPNLIQDPDSKQFPRIYDAFDAAAPGLIGTEPGQIPPWRMPRYLTWQNQAEADQQCKNILHYVLEQAGALNSRGTPIATKVLSLNLWELMQEQSSVALNRSSFTNTYELFKACYPDSVGWRFDQINPGDIAYDGMWQGKTGLETIKNRFAKGLYEWFEALKRQTEPDFQDHHVFFDPGSAKILEINREDMQKLRLYMHKHGLAWLDLMVAFGIQNAFEVRFGGSVSKFFQGVFGTANPQTSKLGKSDLYLEDIEQKITGHHEAVDNLEKDLDSVVKANEVIYRPQDEKNLIETLIKISKSRPDDDSYTRKLYVAYATTKSKKLIHDEELGESTLAKVLSAKKEGSAEYYLSPRSFNGLMDLQLELLIDRTNLSDHVKKLAKAAIKDLIDTKEKRNVLRGRLIDCIRRDPDFDKKSSLVSLINRTLELAFNDVQRYESAFKKSYGRSTSLYKRTVVKLDNKARTAA